MFEMTNIIFNYNKSKILNVKYFNVTYFKYKFFHYYYNIFL